MFLMCLAKRVDNRRLLTWKEVRPVWAWEPSHWLSLEGGIHVCCEYLRPGYRAGG